MKKLLSLLVLIAVAPFVLNAEVQETMEMQVAKAVQVQNSITAEPLSGFSGTQTQVESDVVNLSPGYDTTFITRAQNPPFSFAAATTCMNYEPISQTVSILESYYTWTDTDQYGLMRVISTSDLGETFAIRDIIEETQLIFPLQSSITAFNLYNSEDPQDLQYLCNYRSFEWDEAQQTYFAAQGINIAYVPAVQDGEPETFQVIQPDDNNDAGGYSFSLSRMASAQYDGEAIAYATGYGSPANTVDFQYGPAFFSSFNFEEGDFVANMMLPHYTDTDITYWADSKASGTTSDTYVDTDDEGNVYIGAVNHFFPNHPENGEDVVDRLRTVGFMKSADNGQTWTDWIKCPTEKMKKFMEDNGQDQTANYPGVAGMSPYYDLGFISTGVDEISFVIPIYIVVDGSDDNYQAKSILTEFRYEKGTWNDPVAVYELPEPQVALPTINSAEEDDMDSLDRNGQSGQGLEISLARVVGTKDIVLKFAQWDGTSFPLDTKIEVKDYDRQTNQVIYTELDSMDNTGIFGAAKLNGTWTNAIPIVDDPIRNERGARIPSRVPSATQVPMLYSLAPQASSEEYYRFKYSAGIFDMIPAWYHSYYYGTFNFTSVGVEDNAIMTQDVNMNIYPNPAEADVNIEFTTGTNDNVRMEIFNTLGSKVMTVLPDQIKEAGTKVAPVNVSGLPNGTYYVNLTVGNETFTKTLNVVR